ncbi:MAG: hypothetical protein RR197_05050 [Oscillospiraceae bacterium]
MSIRTPEPPLLPPEPPFRAALRCARCGWAVAPGDDCVALPPGLLCADCADDFLREQTRTAGDTRWATPPPRCPRI